MKNKQHEFILKAFCESKIPEVIKTNAPDLIGIDSFLGGYCYQLLSNKKIVYPKILNISTQDKRKISELIDNSEGKEKQDLVIYYRLIILVELVINEYSNTEEC